MWSILRKYKQWVLLPLILLGVQWSVSYWHHHEEVNMEETHFASAHEECFVCDWILFSSHHTIEVPLISFIVGLLFCLSLYLSTYYKSYPSYTIFSFFFGRAPPVVIR